MNHCLLFLLISQFLCLSLFAVDNQPAYKGIDVRLNVCYAIGPLKRSGVIVLPNEADPQLILENAAKINENLNVLFGPHTFEIIFRIPRRIGHKTPNPNHLVSISNIPDHLSEFMLLEAINTTLSERAFSEHVKFFRHEKELNLITALSGEQKEEWEDEQKSFVAKICEPFVYNPNYSGPPLPICSSQVFCALRCDSLEQAFALQKHISESKLTSCNQPIFSEVELKIFPSCEFDIQILTKNNYVKMCAKALFWAKKGQKDFFQLCFRSVSTHEIKQDLAFALSLTKASHMNLEFYTIEKELIKKEILLIVESTDSADIINYLETKYPQHLFEFNPDSVPTACVIRAPSIDFCWIKDLLHTVRRLKYNLED